jgi:drug/metabolite transporter (DMT)-like permease
MRRVWIAMMLASVGWGTGGVATRVALAEGASPYSIAVYRGGIAAAAVIVFIAVRRRGVPRTAAAWKVGVAMGASNLALPFILTNIALQYASAGFVGLMTALIPITTAVTAHFMLADEPLVTARLVGLVVALSGVVVLLGSGDSGLAEGGRPVFAGSLALAAVVSISWGGVYAKRYAGRYRALDVSGVQFLSGSLMIVAAMLVAEGVPGGETALTWGMLTYLGVVATFMPFVLFYWMLRRVSATYASLVGYLVPSMAVVSGIVFLDERLQAGMVAGGLLIFVGVVLTDRSYRMA